MNSNTQLKIYLLADNVLILLRNDVLLYYLYFCAKVAKSIWVLKKMARLMWMYPHMCSLPHCWIVLYML